MADETGADSHVKSETWANAPHNIVYTVFSSEMLIPDAKVFSTGAWGSVKEEFDPYVESLIEKGLAWKADTIEELAEKEVNKLTTVMTELQRAIQAELERKDGPQLMLDLGGDEPGKQQRERDLAALRHRLQEIPLEIQRESEHIRSRYASPTARLFPVAVTWLIPRRAVLEVTGGRV